jgi:hypothetical protein
MTTQSRSLRLADQLSANPYAWPGGYPLYGVFHDGGACCAKCASTERESIGTTTGTDGLGSCGDRRKLGGSRPLLFQLQRSHRSAYGEADA